MRSVHFSRSVLREAHFYQRLPPTYEATRALRYPRSMSRLDFDMIVEDDIVMLECVIVRQCIGPYWSVGGSELGSRASRCCSVRPIRVLFVFRWSQPLREILNLHVIASISCGGIKLTPLLLTAPDMHPVSTSGPFLNCHRSRVDRSWLSVTIPCLSHRPLATRPRWRTVFTHSSSTDLHLNALGRTTSSLSTPDLTTTLRTTKCLLS